MKVIINFKIDIETLRCAIASLLYLGEKINKKTLLKIIGSAVFQKGHSVIDFPEFWGDNIWDNFDSDLIESLVVKYKSVIGL